MKMRAGPTGDTAEADYDYDTYLNKEIFDTDFDEDYLNDQMDDKYFHINIDVSRLLVRKP